MTYTPQSQFQFTAQPPAGSFSLGRTLRDERELLFFHAGGKAHLVHVDNWYAYDAASSTVPVLMQTGLHIEPDLSSAFNPQQEYCASGTFALADDEQSLYLMFVGRFSHPEQERIAIIDTDHTTTPPAVAFSRWALVRGKGKEREVVREFDVGRANGPVR